jgi:cathepsin L
MRYAVVALLTLCVASTLAVRSENEYRSAFLSFMHANQRTYAHDAFQAKYATFKTNVDIIDASNAENSNLVLAINKFADLSSSEFKALYTGYKARTFARNVQETLETPVTAIPDAINWADKGAVTPIKNQGQCGSCWAFSSTGSLEGLNFIFNGGKLLSFSEQQLVDCSASYGNDGCNGGLMDNAFEYVAAQGIELEATYPYTAETGTCQYKKSETKFSNKGHTDVTANSPVALATAIAQQPISVAVEADQAAWQFYSSGVVTPAKCGTQLDHGVLAVGYGVESGDNVYIVKNSWGADWGVAGYIYLQKTTGNDAGTCGIQMEPSYPTL